MESSRASRRVTDSKACIMEWFNLEGASWQWSASPTGRPWARPTVEDLWLIECVYAFIAVNSACTACSRPLSRHIELQPGYKLDTSTWTIVAVTRCRGWRRHQHTAVVTEASRDLVFGQFHR